MWTDCRYRNLIKTVRGKRNWPSHSNALKALMLDQIIGAMVEAMIRAMIGASIRIDRELIHEFFIIFSSLGNRPFGRQFTFVFQKPGRFTHCFFLKIC